MSLRANLPLKTEQDPHEMVMTATELRKKRVEVKLKDLGEEDQLRFAAAKDKELKAWLSHKTVQKVAQGKSLIMPSCAAAGYCHGRGPMGMNHLENIP